MAAQPVTERAKREARWGWLFISPWILGFLAFTLGPMIASLVLSLTRYAGGSSVPEFVGIENYVKLFTDPKFYNSLRITFQYAVLALPVGLVAGFLLAYLLNFNIPGMTFWRTLFYMPSVVSGVVVAMLFRGLFNEQYGIINYVIEMFGLEGPKWLQDPRYTLFAFVFIALWGVGGGMIIYLAGLQSIQTSYYEAAELDGCNRRQKLWHITIPHMTPIIFFNLVMGIIECFNYFATPMVLTRGGPAEATMFYNIYLYNNAFKYQSMGYASAMAWVLFFIVLVLTMFVIKGSTFWVYYEGEVKKG